MFDQASNQVSNDLTGKVVVVTGGAGVLCTTICRRLAYDKANVVILDTNKIGAEDLCSELTKSNYSASAIACDVLDQQGLDSAAQQIVTSYGRIDILINGAGGNNSRATTTTELSFFDLPQNAIEWVIDLNLVGTMLACQVFGRFMATQKQGSILNISSMSAIRPLTRIPAYSAAKAAISNFTQWLAVHMAQEYSPEIRVNAIAPGFFLTTQNHYLLVDEATGDLTKRGQDIISHTPMKRFGTPEDLLGTILWLLSPGSSFITGIVVPIDGGFSAFSGV